LKHNSGTVVVEIMILSTTRTQETIAISLHSC